MAATSNSDKELKPFKQVYNAQEEFLQNRKGFTILKTKYYNSSDKPVIEMIEWCKKNISGSFSIARNDSTDWLITIRIWDNNMLAQFKTKFSDHLIGV